MAQLTVRANLSSVQIPLQLDEFGRSVIIRDKDMNYVPTVTAKSDVDKDIGIPQVIYAQNVLPTSYGYKSMGNYVSPNSVGFLDNLDISHTANFIDTVGTQIYLAVRDKLYYNPNTNDFIEVENLRKAVITAGVNTGTGQLAYCTVKQNAVLDTYTITFTSATIFQVKLYGLVVASGVVGGFVTLQSGKVTIGVVAGTTAFTTGDSFTFAIQEVVNYTNISIAQVSGRDFICMAISGVFEYTDSGSFTWTQLTGVDMESLLGICQSSGYLIAWNQDTVAWSSTVDVLDLLPSLATGAGGGSIEEAKGPIQFCSSVTGGFVIFTANNAVAATFSQNARFPFSFKEITNAGGLQGSSKYVTEETAGTSIYAYTTVGIQQITLQKAQTVVPEVSDFLGSYQSRYFDPIDMQVKVLNKSVVFVNISYIASRYLVVSYNTKGADAYGRTYANEAIFYDTTLQRFGKLALDHVALFSYGTNLRAIDVQGVIHQLNYYDLDNPTITYQDNFSFILLGRLQVTRGHNCTLQEVIVDGFDSSSENIVHVADLPALDGYNFDTAVPGYLAYDGGVTRTYSFRNTAVNHTVMVSGHFKLASLQVTMSQHGKR